MNWKNLLQAVLFPVVLFVVNWLFALVGFSLDDALVTQLAELIVAFLLTLFFGDTAVRLAPRYFK